MTCFHALIGATVSIAAAMLLNVATAQAQAPQAQADALKSLTQFHDALKRGDASAATDQLSADALIYESGHAESRDEYLAHHLGADIAFAKDTRRIVKATTAQCSETHCVLMQEGETTGSYKGKKVHSLGVETSVLQRVGAQWKIQHVHWSSRK